MGLHTGEPAVGGADYVGLDVHRAARICAAGHGGQVLISSTTRELVADELSPDVVLRDLGEHRLKDLDRPEHLFQLVVGGLPPDFPPLGRCRPSRAGDADALPPSPNRTIGREDDVRAIADRLRAGDVRLLTLTGPAGSARRGSRSRPRARSRRTSPTARASSRSPPCDDPRTFRAAIVQALAIVAALGREPASRRSSASSPPSTCCWCSTTVEHLLAAAPLHRPSCWPPARR